MPQTQKEEQTNNMERVKKIKVKKYISTKKYKKKKKMLHKTFLRSNIKFDIRIAKQFSPTGYYLALGNDTKNIHLREGEKLKISTPKQDRVSKILENLKNQLRKRNQGIFHTIKAIYNRNKKHALEGLAPPTHHNIYSLVCSIPMLVTAYAKVRKNKGAMTLAHFLPYRKLKWLNFQQRRFLSKASNSPDGINFETFEIASKLLKQGKYPWGTSRRIYLDKPGQPGKMRPVTIPPFMDRIIQNSIKTILVAIYEPWFEKTNRSFGYRPNKGVHDAIYNLIRQENRGLDIAIEGDIKGAYDNVIKDKLIKILSERIQDKKFLNMMQERLNYIYYDSSKGMYCEDQRGLPQGGIDSPYLWNIYMHSFDVHINEYLNSYLESLNKKVRVYKEDKYKEEKRYFKDEACIPTPYRQSLINLRRKYQAILKFLNKNPTFKDYKKNIEFLKLGKTEIKDIYENIENYPETSNIVKKEFKYNYTKKIKEINHKLINHPSADINKRRLRHVYCRYADDWVILGNFNERIAQKIKTYIESWLKTNLEATLSIEKTTITNITEKPCHFLGFEIKTNTSNKLSYTTRNGKDVLARVAGPEITAWPDKQRLINKLHMKGYCRANGDPIGLPWLTNLETFVIIERFNSVLRGFANYYEGFIHFPSALNRWIYILRFSAIKTIAKKYNISLAKVFKRFGLKTKNGTTIKCSVRTNITSRGKKTTLIKNWILLTYKDLVKYPKSGKRSKLKLESGKKSKPKLENKRFLEIKERFNSIEYKKLMP